MRQFTFIPILAVMLVTSSAILSAVLAEPFRDKGCRDDPTIRVVERSGKTYSCHDRVCCLTKACVERTAPPTTKEICVLKGLPSDLKVPQPVIIPRDLPLQGRKEGTTPTPCNSATALLSQRKIRSWAQ